MYQRPRVVATLATLATLAMVSSAAALTADSLPGGTSITVDNTSPTDGDQFLIDIGDATRDITDEGTATVGAGDVAKDTSIIYVIDRSGSTQLTAGVNCDGAGGNDSRLVCEKVGALAANTAAADPFSVIADSAVVQFNDGASIVQGLTSNFGSVATAINSLTFGGATNFQAARFSRRTSLPGHRPRRTSSSSS